MNAEFTKILMTSFPKLYRGATEPISQNLMSFGFECGDGWFLILWNLSKKLEEIGCKAIQVKEKYAGLRFYVDGATDDAYRLIHIAEAESYRTCETCGRPGKAVDAPWTYTACREHVNPAHRHLFDEEEVTS